MAEFDIIVFNQNELERALKDGIRKIALCDNSFYLPMTKNTEYHGIGNVDALIDKEYADYGIKCIGFEPEIKERQKYPAFLMSPKRLSLNTKSHISSYSSYGFGSYGSYAAASYTTSYRLVSSYKMVSSYNMSNNNNNNNNNGAGSYMFGSYKWGSYNLGSYTFGSYTPGSYTLGSYTFGSYRPEISSGSWYIPDSNYIYGSCMGFGDVIFVGGYGVNLV